jgi:quinoprotein relay system zinc metallohydrolase 2
MFLTLVLLAAPGLVAAAEVEPSVEPFPLTQIADGIFVYSGPYELATPQNLDAISNAGFIIGRDGVAVIDSSGSFAAGRRLLAAIRTKTGLPIRYVIDTHVHPDHLLGNAAFLETGATIVGHKALPEALAARATDYLAATRRLIGDAAFAGTEAVPPTLLVADRLSLDLGDRPLELEAWPTGHTNSDLTVLDRKTNTWFLGDLLFSGHIPALDGSLTGWLGDIERAKARPAARVVPGHGPAVMAWPDAAGPMQRYLERLRDDVRTMIRAGRTIREAAEQAGRSEAGNWVLFDDFNARNATTAFHELEWE